ncbi:MAG TPA: molecular chaperone DnaJ [Acidimicrobiales bacterium]|nr:molecular chaperone DnaJ [Acidimicrobiales bacterium]
MASDYYALLGVSPQAGEDEIKRAYRRMARELHPDSTGGDAEAEARFKEVTRAYEVLRDPERRARYDRFGPEGVDGPGGVPGDVFGSGLGDLFDAFFGGAAAGGRRRGGPGRGDDAELVLELSFGEAVFGATRQIELDTLVSCEACGASGARPGTTPVSCPECQGTGELRRVRQSILGQVVTAVPCRRCGGAGEVVSSPCPECRGAGRRSEHRSFSVDIPAGVDHASTLRLSGRGPAGPRGGPPGDLYVHLSVRPDDRFVRDGDDLHAELHVSMAQAALGVSAAFETLDGAETIAVAPGTQTGHVVRLRGRGVPHVRGRGRGDLLVTVAVDTPTALTKAQEELLRKLAAERGEDVAPADEGLLSRLRSAFG